MKYEAVFGDQSLFDDAPIEATHAAQGGGFYRATDGGGVQYLSRGPLNGDMCNFIDGYLIAERRIIAEPKRWTVEDKKAGKLPPIGSRYLAGSNKREFTCLFHGKGNGTNSIVGYTADGEVTGFYVQYCYPIETPAEKAQRLRSEWVKHALDLYMSSPKNDVESMGDVYDAMLSGELAVPKGGE